MVRAILICLFAVALTSCGDTNRQTAQSVTLGEEVTLERGSSVTFEPADIVVQFIGVSADSRCPRDVTCMWGGEVRVQLSIRNSQQPPIRHEILAGESAVIGAYRISVVRVQPEPVASSKIAPEAYQVTLQLHKA